MRLLTFIFAIACLAHSIQSHARPIDTRPRSITCAAARVYRATRSFKLADHNQDFISFIVPCYNCAHTIKETLDSIYAQNLELDAFEVICIDDASADKTWDVLQHYAKRYSNLRVHKNSTHQGPAQTRNIAISTLAQGELLYALDADNVLIKNTVPNLLPLIKPKDVDVACFEGIAYFASSILSPTIKRFQFSDHKVTIHNAHQAILLMGSGNYLFKKSSFKRAGGYTTFAEETWALSFNMLATGGTFAILPDTYYLHRTSAHSKWMVDERANRNRAAVLSTFRAHSEIFTPQTNTVIARYSTQYANPMNDFKEGKMHLQSQSVLDCLFAAYAHEHHHALQDALNAYRQAIALGGDHPNVTARIRTLEKAIATREDSMAPTDLLRNIF